MFIDASGDMYAGIRGRRYVHKDQDERLSHQALGISSRHMPHMNNHWVDLASSVRCAESAGSSLSNSFCRRNAYIAVGCQRDQAHDPSSSWRMGNQATRAKRIEGRNGCGRLG